jgi:hypothetical protein
MHRKGITATRCAVSGLICLLSSQLPAAVEAAAAALKNLTASETGGALSGYPVLLRCVRAASLHAGHQDGQFAYDATIWQELGMCSFLSQQLLCI